MSCELRNCIHCIIPPYIFDKLMDSHDKAVRNAAIDALTRSAQLRGARNVASRGGASASAASGGGRRTIFDCQHQWTTTGAVLSRSEDGHPSTDKSVNQLFDGLGKTRDFFMDVFHRDSIDDNGIRLDGYVHFGVGHNNAGWNGSVMLFGDGDGKQFQDFTNSLDVIAHELVHGVTQYTADFRYFSQSGALNESMSDVFGSLVKQWSRGESASSADWLIGQEIWTPEFPGDALRSLKEPGRAFNHPLFGKDPQPDHMSKYDHGPGDNQMVHINSGIPNKAFYLTSIGIGGNAWEAPGQIWYEALKASTPNTDFQEFADTTYFKAGQLYGAGSDEQQSVHAAWREVGIRISGAPAAASRVRRGLSVSAAERDTGVGLAQQIEALAIQVKTLTREMKSLKEKKVS